MLVTCQWLRLVHWATLIYTEFFKKFQVFPKVKFVQSLSFSKVNFFPKFKFVQSFSSFKIMDFLKCSRASQWHCVPGCILCKRVSPKRNAPKNILKNPLFKVHYGFKFQVFSKVQVCSKFIFFKVQVCHSSSFFCPKLWF